MVRQKHRRKRSARFSAGFTLLELVIVVTISVIIVTMLITTNSATRNQVSLYVETSKFTQVVLRAKSAALAATDPVQAVVTSSPTLSPVCGYGVHVDRAAGRYFLFRYGDPRNSSLSCKSQLAQIDPMDSTYATIGSDQVLPTGITFPAGDPEEMSEVFFMPPYPTVFMSAAPFGPLTSSTDTVGSVVFATGDPAKPITTRVTVTGAGQVNF